MDDKLDALIGLKVAALFLYEASTQALAARESPFFAGEVDAQMSKMRKALTEYDALQAVEVAA